MPNLSPKVALISTFTTALLLSVNHAHALEGKALLEKLISTSSVDRKLTWDSATEQTPDSFTLKGVKFITFQKEPAIIGNLVIQGLREGSNGQVEFDNLIASDIASIANDGKLMKIQSLQTSKLSLPGALLTWTFPEEVQNSRISFEGFSINNVDINHPTGTVNLESVKIANADFPLKYQYMDTSPEGADVPPPLTIGALDLNNFTGKSNGIDWSLGSIAMANAKIPTSLNVPQTDWMKVYSTLSVNNIVTSFAGTEVFRMDTLTGTINDPDAEGTIKTDSVMKGLFVNLKAIPDPNTQQIASQLGYDKVEGSMTGIGTYNPTSGRVSLDDLSLNLKDMADIQMSYGFTGYTEDVAKALNLAQLDTAMGKPPMEAYMKHIPILSKVLLDGFKLKLTDHSLTGRILDFQGTQMGMTGDQLAQGAPMMLGMGMAGLQMPAFTEMVTKAIGSFLQNKGSLTVQTKLDKPISIIETVLAGQVDPKSVPTLLKLEVSGE